MKIPVKLFLSILLIIPEALLLAQTSVNVNTTFTITIGNQLTPISPFIYGTNQLIAKDANFTSFRQGGNRMTGYNWENNFSNAGSDYNQSSDTYLIDQAKADGRIPASVTASFIDNANKMNAYSLVTLQLAGYVSKDKNGTVSQAETAPSNRWAEVKFTKGSPLVLTPDLNDNYVYMDEYVNFLVNKYGKANTQTGVKGFSLDNEPALWPSTHPRIHPNKTTCQEIVQKGIDVAKAVKNIDPYAEIFGPVLYGFAAYTGFQDAPDWTTVKAGKNYSWFIDYYLDQMKKAGDTAGKRLLDVLDLHWYPEAKGDHRITERNATTDADKAARVQAPRTLWDPGYTENSWIGQWGKTNLPLLPKLKASIDKYYPGTKLAFTEITYGGPTDISGAIAMCDVLGLFGKYNVYLANLWPLTDNAPYLASAYKMYMNYDGLNAYYGNLYVPSQTSDIVNSSVYASIKNGKKEIHLIVLNKDFSNTISGTFNIITSNTVVDGRVWILDKSSSEIHETTPVSGISGNSFTYSIPAGSVCHFVLRTNEVLTNVEKFTTTAEKYNLSSYPNPFNATTTIVYNLPEPSHVRLKIYDMLGREIFDIVNEEQAEGEYKVLFNASSLPSGMYVYTIEAGSFRESQKLLLMK